MTDERTSTDELRMDAYYYGFNGTGVASIDKLLSAVACAGKSFHHTRDWTESVGHENEPHAGSSPVEWIQNAASEAASEIERLRAALKPFANMYKLLPREAPVRREVLYCYNSTEGCAELRVSDLKRTAEVLK